MLTLTEIQSKVAVQDIRCDASKDLIDFVYGLTLNNNRKKEISRHFIPAFKVRLCKILKGEAYKKYQFVDDDGELHEINCSVYADTYMLKEGLYPFEIKEL